MGIYTDDEFEEKVAQFEPLLWYAAKRLEIPGVLPKEDLYQEGLRALDATFEEHFEYDPDSEEFTRAFKSRLFHRISHCLRKHKTGSRDWRKEVHDSISSFSEEGDSIFDRISQTVFPPPDYLLELEDLHSYLDALEVDLKDASLDGPLWGNSAEDALEVLRLVTDPDYDIPDEVKMLYERIPSKITNPLIADIKGWDLMKVRRAISRLRKHARLLAPYYGITPPKDK